MNYFAHGYQFLDNPYFLAGTAVPDWLSVVDRKVRARSKGAQALTDDEDPRVAAVAQGIVQHHHDDDWFHQTRAFAELSWQFTVSIRDSLRTNDGASDDGLRPSFLGHILVELLLDSEIAAQSPGLLEQYYAALDVVDPLVVQTSVNLIASRQTDTLHEFIDLFRTHRFLFDYADDEKLLFRLNQVMRRVRLSALPDSLAELFTDFRTDICERYAELLTPNKLDTT